MFRVGLWLFGYRCAFYLACTLYTVQCACMWEIPLLILYNEIIYFSRKLIIFFLVDMFAKVLSYFSRVVTTSTTKSLSYPSRPCYCHNVIIALRPQLSQKMCTVSSYTQIGYFSGSYNMSLYRNLFYP